MKSQRFVLSYLRRYFSIYIQTRSGSFKYKKKCDTYVKPKIIYFAIGKANWTNFVYALKPNLSLRGCLAQVRRRRHRRRIPLPLKPRTKIRSHSTTSHLSHSCSIGTEIERALKRDMEDDKEIDISKMQYSLSILFMI